MGNVGDSRAVLCRGGRAVPLSNDHTTKRLDEGNLPCAASLECDSLLHPPHDMLIMSSLTVACIRMWILVVADSSCILAVAPPLSILP